MLREIKTTSFLKVLPQATGLPLGANRRDGSMTTQR